MSISLEIKKFINSEHVGEYIDIFLRSAEADLRRTTPKDAGAADDYAGTDATQESARIHYIEKGEGEPLILIHSVGQSMYTWRKVFDRLSGYYRVIAIDLPGHGYSSRPELFGYGVQDYAYAIKEFMDEMGIQSAHFVAFSLAAAYVMEIAYSDPERIGKVVLISPGGITAEMPSAIKLIDSPVFGFIASVLYNLKTVEKLLNESVFDLTNIDSDVVGEYYKTVCDSPARRAVRFSVQRFDDERTVSDLRDVDAPVLIIQGGEDRWHPSKECAELYHAALKNAMFSVVRNAGHLVQEEKPDRIVAAILEFIPVIMP